MSRAATLCHSIQRYDCALSFLPNQGELHFHLGAALVHKGEITKGLQDMELSKQRMNRHSG